MPTFASFDGARIAYRLEGTGPPVVLLHGFGADADLNWELTGLGDAVRAVGRTTVAPDARGHGASAKPHDDASYADDAMARDVVALLDHLDLAEVDVAGYSMGAILGAVCAAREPRVRSLFLGGIGIHLLDRGDDHLRIAEALETDDPEEIEDPTTRAFRTLADGVEADRRALAAVQRGRHDEQLPVDGVRCPTLVVTGEDDTLAGSPVALARRFAEGEGRLVPGDHLTALLDPAFREALVDWLRPAPGGHPAAD